VRAGAKEGDEDDDEDDDDEEDDADDEEAGCRFAGEGVDKSAVKVGLSKRDTRCCHAYMLKYIVYNHILYYISFIYIYPLFLLNVLLF
jgi:hypothetical protein